MKSCLLMAVCALLASCDIYNESLLFGPDGGGGARPMSSSTSSTSSTASAAGVGGTSSSTSSAETSSDASTSSSSSATSSSSGGGLYWKSGVLLDVPKADMTGWTECYSGLYADTGIAQQQILAQCPGSKLALACRPKGSATFGVLAMGDKADVTFMFSAGDNTGTHVANGIGWYMSPNNWGFVPGGDPLWKGPMDVMGISPNSPGPDGDKRLSWTGNNGDLWVGYRCGYDCGDNHPGFDYTYERVVLTAP